MKPFQVVLLLLVTIVGFIHYTESASFATNELDSYKWLVYQYQLTTCNATLPCSCPSMFTCDASNSTLVSIFIINGAIGPQNTLPTITKFTFNNLVSLVLNFTGTPSTLTNTNILSMIKDLPALQTLVIESDPTISSTGIPSTFPTGLPSLRNLTLSDNLIKSIPSNFWTGPMTNVVLNEIFTSIAPPSSVQSIQSFSFMYKSLSNPNPLNLLSSSFPSLQKLKIYYYAPNWNLDIRINLPNLKSLMVMGDTIDDYATVDITGTSNLEYLLLLKLAFQATFAPRDLSTFTKLTKLEIVKPQTVLISKLPPNLIEFTYNQSQGTDFPLFPSYPTSLKYINFNSNIDVTGDIPSYFLNGTTNPTVLMNSNGMLSTDIPNTLCGFAEFRLTGANVGTYPPCYQCYRGISGLPITIPAANTPPTCSGMAINNITHILTTSNILTITGTNLGWAVAGDVTPGLNYITPNTKFTLPINVTSELSPKSVVFSSTKGFTYNIYWQSAMITIDNAAMAQGYNSTILDINGFISYSSFNHSITVNGFPCVNFVLITQTHYQCIVNQILIEGSYNLTITNNYTSTSKILSYSYQFPIVTSYSPITVNGGLLELEGNFGFGNISITQISLNSLVYEIQSMNQSYISLPVISLPEGTTVLQVNVAGYNYRLNSLRVDPINLIAQCIQSTNNCTNGNGVCNNRGECVCQSGFYGQNCQSQSGSGVFIPNNATGSFQSSGYQISFKLESVQELDLSNDIVREIKAINWTIIANTTTSTNNLIAYQLNMTNYGDTYSNVNITIFIEFTSIEKIIKFAGTQLTIAPNSLKVSLQINNWNYLSNLNHLRPVFRAIVSGGSNSGCQGNRGKIGMDTFQSIRYLSIVKNNTQFYSRFLDVVESDGRAAYTQNQLLSDPSLLNNANAEVLVGIHLPRCNRCMLDPDFSPLLNVDGDNSGGNDQCQDNNSNPESFSTWKIITISVVGGAAIVVSIIVYKVRSYKLKSDKKRVEKKLETMGSN